MRHTAQITIQRMPKGRRRYRWPLSGTGMALVMLLLGAGLVGFAFVGH
jgi:hypothetical protein